MKTSIAIWLLVGLAIGAFMAGLMQYGDFLNLLNMPPIGRIVLLAVALIIGLGAMGAYFHSKRSSYDE